MFHSYQLNGKNDMSSWKGVSRSVILRYYLTVQRTVHVLETQYSKHQFLNF